MTSPTPSSGSSSEPQQEPPGRSAADKKPPATVDPVAIVDAKTRRVIALVVTGMWAVGIIADAAFTTFELSPFVYLTMLGLASAIFGADFVKGMKA